MRPHSPISFFQSLLSLSLSFPRWFVNAPPHPCSSTDIERPSSREQPPSPTSVTSMAISTSASPYASGRDRGRPKLKTKTLDGTTVDDEDGPDISTDTTMTTPPILGRSKRVPSWRSSERGVPVGLKVRSQQNCCQGFALSKKTIYPIANSPFVAPPPPPLDLGASTPTQAGYDMEDARKKDLNGSERGAVPVVQWSRDRLFCSKRVDLALHRVKRACEG